MFFWQIFQQKHITRTIAKWNFTLHRSTFRATERVISSFICLASRPLYLKLSLSTISDFQTPLISCAISDPRNRLDRNIMPLSIQ